MHDLRKTIPHYCVIFQARGEKRRGKKGGSPSNEFLESVGPGSSAVGSQGSSDAGEYIRWVLQLDFEHL